MIEYRPSYQRAHHFLLMAASLARIDTQPLFVVVALVSVKQHHTVTGLAQAIGFAPLVTGPLVTARYFETMAHLNIAIAVGRDGGTNAAFLYDQAA